jgi:ferredoxin
MPDLTSAALKKFAGTVGVDVLGVAPIERFEGAPPGRHPADLYPDAKSVITIGFRITRGSLRGIEEGTDWAAYDFMSYGGIVMMYSVIAQRELSRFIEDHGYEAVPFIHTCSKQAGEPVAPGKPRPDVLLNERILAVAAGMGEIGYSRMFLSTRFGPAIRVFPILTNAVLQPDPMVRTGICDGCRRCVKECPPEAISASQTESVTIAGQTYEMGNIDIDKCSWCHHGGMRAVSPFISRDVSIKGEGGVLYSKELMDIPYCGSQNRLLHHVAICGAAGCVRACMIHLEEKGRISQVFKAPFRVRTPWWPLSPAEEPSRPAKRSSSSRKPRQRTEKQRQLR